MYISCPVTIVQAPLSLGSYGHVCVIPRYYYYFQACHKEAVQALQSVKGDCALCVQFIATDDDDRLSEDNYRYY